MYCVPGLKKNRYGQPAMQGTMLRRNRCRLVENMDFGIVVTRIKLILVCDDNCLL